MDVTSPKEPETTIRTRERAPLSRYFFVGMVLLLMAIVFVGFWPTYFGSVFLGQEPAEFGFVEISWPIHLHAAVFVGWMALLLAQTTLAVRGETRTHMRLGRYGMAFGLALILVGVFITLVQMQTSVAEGIWTWAEAPFQAWESWVTILQFALLLGLGYSYRTRPEAHKRYMVLATVVLVLAATSRMRLLIGPWSMEIMLVVMAGPLFAYDLYTERRVHRATLIGTGVLLVFFVLRVLLDW